MRIATHDLAEKILVVAEIGNNHEGNFEVAGRMVDAAADAGVDAVKFQTFQTRLFTSQADPARFERLSKFELLQDQFAQLERRARARGLIFLSTPLDLVSARFLEPLVDVFKVASGDNDFWPLIAQLCATGKPLIISTGLADLAHIARVAEFVRAAGAGDRLALLQCVCAYPAPPGEVNLRAIPRMAAELGVPIGWSDHTLGPDACLAAAAIGARIIEKHFTLDKNLSSFRDHQLSADPAEMRQIVDGVRRVEQLLGTPDKRVQPSEESNLRAARRSIAAAAPLAQGHRIRAEDLIWVRPAIGLPPGSESRLIGHVLGRDIAAGEAIAERDVD
ncbi:MAG TPA: N-acetylneuraminate synthase family protein [Kofleriaceae bacterium]|jgi:sialic acid synthase SpsE|nr:N-acetylneuraminate synthase family protein [Kofleriaceae bacterium]